MDAETIIRKTPGVYIKGTPPTPHPPVPSGITGFVGVCADGPYDLPTPISNWGEFMERFGGFVPFGDLPHAVYGFFLNGGQLCYVVRVGRRGTSDGVIQAGGTLKDEDGIPRIRIVSKKKGSEGNDFVVAAVPFTATTALIAPQVLPDEKRDNGDDIHFISVHNIDAFDEDRGKFRISSGANGETVKIDRDGARIATHRLILRDQMPDEALYPEGAVLSNKRRFNILVKTKRDNEPLEIFYNLSMNPGNNRYFQHIIDGHSRFISVSHAGTEGLSRPPVGETQLSGGKDPGQIDYRYYTGYDYDNNGNDSYYAPGDPGTPLGLAALEEITDVSLVAVPGLERGEPVQAGNQTYDFHDAQTHILRHCRKMGDRFAILDPEGEANIPDFQDGDAKFGALYFPRLYCVTDGTKRLTPPSGFIAGVMARTDRQSGTHKAPANEKIKGVVDLEYLIGMNQQDELNEAGVNCIRKFEEGKIKVWGARTLSKEKKWRYVNVRRTYLNIIKILSKKLLWAVFEPNDKSLWKRIQTSLTSYLLSLTAGGVTAGSRPAEAFYVKCNEETNPGEVVEAGQVIAEIGIALAAPAEFIVITVKKTPESLNVFEEEV